MHLLGCGLNQGQGQGVTQPTQSLVSREFQVDWTYRVCLALRLVLFVDLLTPTNPKSKVSDCLTWDHKNKGCVRNENPDRSRFVRRDRSSPMKKNAFVRFITMTHTITSLYPIIFFIGMLTSRASWAWLKNLPWSQIFLRCIRADLQGVAKKSNPLSYFSNF